MNLQTELYINQKSRWPAAGKVILAQFDAATIIVYQAYRPEIGHFADRHGYFGGEFSYNRMSWIKANFLWMMYRNGWGTKEGQEVTLAVRLKREAFDFMLAQAVSSTYHAADYPGQAEWQTALQQSQVRLQWDPDHDPAGAKLERRAVQLGLRGEVLRQFGREWLVEIEDISEFVREQREKNLSSPYSQLLTPAEQVYPLQQTPVRPG